MQIICLVTVFFITALLFANKFSGRLSGDYANISFQGGLERLGF